MKIAREMLGLTEHLRRAEASHKSPEKRVAALHIFSSGPFVPSFLLFAWRMPAFSSLPMALLQPAWLPPFHFW